MINQVIFLFVILWFNASLPMVLINKLVGSAKKHKNHDGISDPRLIKEAAQEHEELIKKCETEPKADDLRRLLFSNDFHYLDKFDRSLIERSIQLGKTIFKANAEQMPLQERFRLKDFLTTKIYNYLRNQTAGIQLRDLIETIEMSFTKKDYEEMAADGFKIASIFPFAKAFTKLEQKIPKKIINAIDQYEKSNDLLDESFLVQNRFNRQHLDNTRLTAEQFMKSFDKTHQSQLLAIRKKWINGQNLFYGVNQVLADRKTQEDRFSVGSQDNVHWAAVFDGHGGHQAAEYASKYLIDRIISHADFKKGNESNNDALITQATQECFQQIDIEISNQTEAGTTAVVTLICNNKIYTAYCGDSRAIVSGFRSNNNNNADEQKFSTESLTRDHNPYHQQEKERLTTIDQASIIEDKGKLRVIYNGLSCEVSRSLGDRVMKPVISARPDIVIRSIQPDDQFILLYSDGMTNEDFISNHSRYIFNNWLHTMPLTKVSADDSVNKQHDTNVRLARMVYSIRKTTIDPMVIAEELIDTGHQSKDNRTIIYFDLQKLLKSRSIQ